MHKLTSFNATNYANFLQYLSTKYKGLNLFVFIGYKSLNLKVEFQKKSSYFA